MCIVSFVPRAATFFQEARLFGRRSRFVLGTNLAWRCGNAIINRREYLMNCSNWAECNLVWNHASSDWCTARIRLKITRIITNLKSKNWAVPIFYSSSSQFVEKWNRDRSVYISLFIRNRIRNWDWEQKWCDLERQWCDFEHGLCGLEENVI